MTVKEYLHQAYRLDQRIKSDTMEAQNLREMAGSVSAIQYDKDRVQTSRNTEAPFVRTLEKLWTLEKKIAGAFEEPLSAGTPSGAWACETWRRTCSGTASYRLSRGARKRKARQYHQAEAGRWIMTYDDVITMLEEAGLPLAYDHFAEGESPDPPFLVFLYPGSDNMFADDTVFKKIDELNIELYTDVKDPETETQIEDILIAHDLPYEKSEVWIESEKLYEVLYQTQIIGG